MVKNLRQMNTFQIWFIVSNTNEKLISYIILTDNIIIPFIYINYK